MIFRITMRFNEWVTCNIRTTEISLHLREFIVCNERLSSDELCSLSFLQQIVLSAVNSKWVTKQLTAVRLRSRTAAFLL